MRCKTCGQDHPSEQFYVSNKSKCKECIRKAVKQNRIEKIDYYRSYDRMRASQPHRVKARLAYQETDAFRESHNKANKKYLEDQPKRNVARTMVGNAVRDGKLIKQPCLICGSEKVEGHHPDYDRPLEVVWLCTKHHKEAHQIARNYNHKEAA